MSSNVFDYNIRKICWRLWTLCFLIRYRILWKAYWQAFFRYFFFPAQFILHKNNMRLLACRVSNVKINWSYDWWNNWCTLILLHTGINLYGFLHSIIQIILRLAIALNDSIELGWSELVFLLIFFIILHQLSFQVPHETVVVKILISFYVYLFLMSFVEIRFSLLNLLSLFEILNILISTCICSWH